MTPEDRLRQLLQVEDEPPAGDGLQRIQQRVAQRRSLRSTLLPAVAIGGVVAVAAAAAVTVSLTDGGSLTPAHSPSTVASPQPDPSGCAGGLCSEPEPLPTISTKVVTSSGNGIPVWPFATDAQAADWEAQPGSRSWASDPVKVAQHLMDDYLKLPGQATRRTNNDADVALVEVSAAGRAVSQVRLERVGRDTSGPWSVTGATSVDLTVTQPSTGDEVTAPINAVGTVTGVDQSVHLRLTAGEALLADAYAPAGNALPWTQSLPWTRTDWSVAALSASTFDGKGDLSAVSITPVLRSGATSPDRPAAGTVLVAIADKHVVSVDTLSGKVLRQLSFPPVGATDGAPDRGGEDGVVWVRVTGDRCTSSIIRAGLLHGPAGITVDAKPVARSLPSLSAGGRSLSWVEQPCGGGDITVVVRGPDAKFSTVASSPQSVTDLDVRDDGYAVVQVGSEVRVLPPGVTAVGAGTPLQAAGCTLAAPAWNGNEVIAWELCSGAGWRLGRWSTTGALRSRSADVAGMSAPLHTAVADGQVLVALSDSRLARLSAGALADLPNAMRWGQADW